MGRGRLIDAIRKARPCVLCRDSDGGNWDTASEQAGQPVRCGFCLHGRLLHQSDLARVKRQELRTEVR